MFMCQLHHKNGMYQGTERLPPDKTRNTERVSLLPLKYSLLCVNIIGRVNRCIAIQHSNMER